MSPALRSRCSRSRLRCNSPNRGHSVRATGDPNRAPAIFILITPHRPACASADAGTATAANKRLRKQHNSHAHPSINLRNANAKMRGCFMNEGGGGGGGGGVGGGGGGGGSESSVDSKANPAANPRIIFPLTRGHGQSCPDSGKHPSTRLPLVRVSRSAAISRAGQWSPPSQGARRARRVHRRHRPGLALLSSYRLHNARRSEPIPHPVKESS